MDVPFGIVRPELDQIPSACKNWFSVNRWVDVSNDQLGVTWVTLDAPLRLIVKSIQYVLRRCRGRSRAAAKSRLQMRSAAAFLRRGLMAFWKA